MTSSVHTSRDRDEVEFKVSLSAIVMNERALVKAIVIFSRDKEKSTFSIGIRDMYHQQRSHIYMQKYLKANVKIKKKKEKTEKMRKNSVCVKFFC